MAFCDFYYLCLERRSVALFHLVLMISFFHNFAGYFWCQEKGEWMSDSPSDGQTEKSITVRVSVKAM